MRNWLVFACVFFQSLSHGAGLSEYTFTYKDEVYSVWVMNGDGQPDLAVPEDSMEFKVRKAAQDLAADEYAKLGFTRSADLQELMMASRSLVVISEHKKHDKPLQMVSIAKGGPTPIERRMIAHGLNKIDTMSHIAPDSALRFQFNKEGPTSKHQNPNFNQSMKLARRIAHNIRLVDNLEFQDTVATYGALELKALVKSGNSPRGFTPLLSHIVNAHELLIHSGIEIPSGHKQAWYSELIHSRPYLQTMSGNQYRPPVPTYGIDPISKIPNPFKNNEFYIRDIIGVSFRPATTRYFQEYMGFTPIYEIEDPDRAGAKTVILRRRVRDFLERSHLKMMGTREGQILQEGVLHFEQDYEPTDWSKYPGAPNLRVTYPVKKSGGVCRILFDERKNAVRIYNSIYRQLGRQRL